MIRMRCVIIRRRKKILLVRIKFKSEVSFECAALLNEGEMHSFLNK